MCHSNSNQDAKHEFPSGIVNMTGKPGAPKAFIMFPGTGSSGPISLAAARKPAIIFADPWLKESRGNRTLPDDARLVCAFRLDLGVDTVDLATFLRRTPDRDELWVASAGDFSWLRGTRNGGEVREAIERRASPGIGCAFAAVPAWDELSASMHLLWRLLRSYIGLHQPEEFVAPGIISEAAYNSLVGLLDREVQQNTEKALLKETGIIVAARELGLGPGPSGEHPDLWHARCPGRNHRVYLSTAEDRFYCPWCARKGGAAELRAFVEERQSQANR